MYEYHLLFNNGEDLHFPVPLESYQITYGSSNETINLLHFGELPLWGERMLKEWSISGIFPSQNYYFCQCEPLQPYDYVSMIERIKWSKHNCRFVITGTPINIPCTVETFTYGENDGTGDIQFTIDFKEYRILC